MRAHAGQDERRHNLPAQLTSFVGRERDLTDLRGLLRDNRLLTLTGPGGVGKTRLALQLAADVLASAADDFSDGIWLVQLADVVDPALVPYTVALTLDVAEAPGQPMLGRLIDALEPRMMLLVLDNCDHLVTACATLAGSLLRACPGMGILATSREQLNVPGEHVWPVRPLAVPPTGESIESSEYEALKLFAARAQALAPGFTVTRENHAAVATVCRKVEGIPLAIELAAARVRVLSVEELAERLDDRLGLLTGGSRTAAARQETMRGAIDWSYTLLPERERRLFNRLSVFAGGFTLAAAETVCSGQGIQSEAVLDRLTQLIAKSLVVREGLSSESRYRLLEPIRQYGQEQLAASGELAPLLERQARFYRELAEAADRDGLAAGQAAWLELLEREHDNLRAALRWLLERRDEAGLRLAATLGWFWYIRGYYHEAHEWLTAFLSHCPEDDRYAAARTNALWELGQLKWRVGDNAGGRRCLLEALQIQRRVGDDGGAGRSLSLLGRIAHDAGDYGAARRLDEEALSLLRAAGSERALLVGLTDAGRTALLAGDHARARPLLEEAVARSREQAPGRMQAVAAWALGCLLADRGEYEPAVALLGESLTIECELKSKQGIHRTLQGFVHLALARGEWRAAMRLNGVVEALGKQLGIVTVGPDLPHALRPARGALGIAAAERSRNEGAAMTLEQAVAYALTREEPAALRPARPLTADAARLTRREREVVALISQGLSNREIAARLCITATTAGHHVENILAKLGMSSRTKVAAWALQHMPPAQSPLDLHVPSPR
jgi:predicted ATPase/DNA-binding CsgD family transcriptional regulator